MTDSQMNQLAKAPPTFVVYATRVGLKNDLIWTNHALERMWERRVDPKHAVTTAQNPDTELRKEVDGKDYHQMWRELPDGRTVYICLDQAKAVVISVGWLTDEDETGRF